MIFWNREINNKSLKNECLMISLISLLNNLRCESIILFIMGRFGTTEIIVILVVVLLLFGGKKIPELMKGLGSGLNEFKKASKGEDTTKKDETKE